MKTYRYFFIGFIFFMLIANTKAQLPIVETNFLWQKCINNGTAGGIIQIGESYYINSYDRGVDTAAQNYHGDWDLMLIKTDTLGNVHWKKCYGGSLRDTPYSIQKTNDGYIYLIGVTDSEDGDVQSRRWQGRQIWLIKLDPEGEIVWEKTFGVEKGTGFDPRTSLIMPDGGILISSNIQGASGDVSTFFWGNDFWLVRFDAYGNMLWEKTFGSIGFWDNLLSMIHTKEGTVMCAGAASIGEGMVECSLPSYEVYNVWLFEIDLNGNILWQHCYGGTGSDSPQNIIQTNDGFVLCVGSNSWDGDINNPHGNKDFWIFKIDNEGEIIWSNCLGGSGYDSPSYIFELEDGGFMVIGYTRSTDGDVSGIHGWRRDIWFVKVDAQGIGQWQRCVGSYGKEDFQPLPFLIQKNDYTYVMAQDVEQAGGDIQCNQSLFNDHFTWLFKIEFTDQFVSVNELHGQSLNVSPNPANNLMMFELPAIGELCIYSVSGHLLHKAHCLAGDYHYNCGHLSPGVYFYTFMMDEALLHGKVVVE